MTNTNQQAKSLGITAIKTEIARRNPVDDKAVEDAIAHRLRIDELGQPYVVDKSGVRDDYKCLETFLDEFVRDRPDLWKGRPTPTGGTSTVKANPFKRGDPAYNLTVATKMLREDPETAQRLSYEAGIILNGDK